MMDFLQIAEIAFQVTNGEITFLGNIIIDEYNYGEVISNLYDT